jgi:hypothetical protein
MERDAGMLWSFTHVPRRSWPQRRRILELIIVLLAPSPARLG